MGVAKVKPVTQQPYTFDLLDPILGSCTLLLQGPRVEVPAMLNLIQDFSTRQKISEHGGLELEVSYSLFSLGRTRHQLWPPSEQRWDAGKTAPGLRWCMMKEIESPNRSIRP